MEYDNSNKKLLSLDCNSLPDETSILCYFLCRHRMFLNSKNSLVHVSTRYNPVSYCATILLNFYWQIIVLMPKSYYKDRIILLGNKTIEVYKSSVLVQTTQYKVQHEIVLQMTSAVSKAEEGMLPQHFIGTDV